jgi:hypothetical protein
MTIIEVNIAGLHVTRSTPSGRAIKRSWQRNYRAWRHHVHWMHWPAAGLRPDAASDSSAA